MTIEEKVAYVNRVYGLACAKGLCNTRTEFAKILDINPTTLSGAMRSRTEYLTDRMIGRIKLFASANGLDVENLRIPSPEPEQTPDADGFYIPKETARMYTNMSESIRLLSETIAKMQGITLAHPDIVRTDEKKG